MGRGVSCGGGQSSLGYLFGSGESDGNNPPPPAQNPTTEPPQNTPEPADNNSSNVTDEASQNAPSETVNKSNPNTLAPDSTAHDSSTNNYHRADGQNCGNFITNRPSTKVHAAPGGSSSLGYLFTGDEKK